VPSFQIPMITGLAANILGIYTVPGVLPCYRKVLLCYRISVTGNRLVLGICIVLDGLLGAAVEAFLFAYIVDMPTDKYRAFVR